MALITYLTRIQFDFGALKLLEAELQLLGMRRPLIVTDKGVIAAGLWARVKDNLPGNMPITVYDGTPENPTEAAMRDALKIYKEEGCDGIVAVGGGSPMDLAKAVALMATHPGNSLQPYSFVEGGAGKITAAVAPIVAIPTTSGTGSEVSRGGVIIMDSGRKLAIGSPHLIPRLALIDPELTMSLPPHLTAGTGMDAFTHNIECFLSNAFNPPADGIALDGLEKAWKYVERATKDGSDREARYNMAMAAMEGAMVFQKGLGAVHALSHPTGGLQGLPPASRHAECGLPAGGAALQRAGGRREVQARGDAAGPAGGRGERGGRRRCRCFAQRAARHPKGLGAMGLQQDTVEKIADGAMGDHCHLSTPRQPTKAEYVQLIEQSWG